MGSIDNSTGAKYQCERHRATLGDTTHTLLLGEQLGLGHRTYFVDGGWKQHNEYERQEPAPRRGLAPPVLIFQTSPPCNIFTKITKILRNRCQPSHKGLIFGLNYPDFGEIHASPRTKGWH